MRHIGISQPTSRMIGVFAFAAGTLLLCGCSTLGASTGPTARPVSESSSSHPPVTTIGGNSGCSTTLELSARPP
jgi:hypothetical protein